MIPYALQEHVLSLRPEDVGEMAVKFRNSLGFDYCCVFTKLNQEQLQSEGRSTEQVHIVSRTDSSSRFANLVDIKGAVTLAVTITFFLLALSYLENISNPSNLIPLISFSAVSIVSLLFFYTNRKKNVSCGNICKIHKHNNIAISISQS
jgi:hypothetical protein